MVKRGRPAKVLSNEDLIQLQQFLEKLPFLTEIQSHVLRSLLSTEKFDEEIFKKFKTVDRYRVLYQQRQILLEQIKLKAHNQQKLMDNEVEILSLDRLKFELINYQLINDEMKLPRMNELNFKIFEIFFNNNEEGGGEEDQNSNNSTKIEKLSNKKPFYFRKCKKILPLVKNNVKINNNIQIKICSLTCTIDNCELSQYIESKNEQILNFKVTSNFCRQNSKKKRNLLMTEKEKFLNRCI
jgi:hypothetical protein